MAGCPKCSRDLLAANSHKPTVRHPNGYETFRELRAGEKLNIPEKWRNGDLESRPALYFSALPYHDGVTPSTLGDAAAGILGNYAALDAATSAVSALATLDDEAFTHAADNAANLVEGAITEAVGQSAAASAAYARDVQSAVGFARQRLLDMRNALDINDKPSAADARYDVRNALSNAIGNARLALQSFYGGAQPTTPTTPSSNAFFEQLTASAQAAVAAMTADGNYCTSVAKSGTAVNTAVHNFKALWNTTDQPKVPINTGNYEPAVASAITQILGSAPAGCPIRGATPPPPPPPPPPDPRLIAITTPEKKGLSTGAIIGTTLLVATAVGGTAYLATRPKRRPRR